jgi:succinoglycan biosynthesis protein ExoA
MTDTQSNAALIVVPCLNESAHIEGLIDTLISQSQGTGSLIVIADGGSTDGTVDKVKQAAAQHDSLKYLFNPQRLQSAAVNLAVATYGADFEYVIRIDAHAGYPTDYITQLISAAKAKSAASVVVSMDTIGTSDMQTAVAIAQNSKLGNGGSDHRLNAGDGRWVDHGHHALMRIDAFQEVGGYDESFSHNEDAELDQRLTQAGHKIWLTGKTHIDYFPRDSFAGLARQYFGFGAGRARTVLKHKIMPRARQLIPALLFPVALCALLTPFIWLACVPILLWVCLVVVFGSLEARKHDATNNPIGMARVVLSVAIMHMTWSMGFCRSVLRHLLSRLKTPA